MNGRQRSSARVVVDLLGLAVAMASAVVFAAALAAAAGGGQ